MRRGLLSIAVLIVALAGTVGCRSAPPPRPYEPVPATLPQVARQLALPDVSLIDDAVPQPVGVSVEPYHQLSAEECRHLACTNAAAAILIDNMAADKPDPFPWLKSHSSADRLRVITARNLSNEARLRSAAAALELYYKLQEAELLSDVLATSQAEVDKLVESGKVMADRGFTESADYLKLRQQQIELRADRAKLQNGIRRINVELKVLLRLDTTAGRILPSDAIHVNSESLNADQAVQVAIAGRPDLELLRDLIRGLDASTVAAVRQTFAGLVPPLGAVTAATRIFAPGFRALFPMLADGDVEGLRRQLQLHLADREREVAKDLRATVDEWYMQRELVSVARRRQALEAERVRELTVKKSKGASVETEYRRALIDKLTADANVIREAVKWKQIDVRARREMGLLCTVNGCR